MEDTRIIYNQINTMTSKLFTEENKKEEWTEKPLKQIA